MFDITFIVYNKSYPLIWLRDNPELNYFQVKSVDNIDSINNKPLNYCSKVVPIIILQCIEVLSIPGSGTQDTIIIMSYNKVSIGA